MVCEGTIRCECLARRTTKASSARAKAGRARGGPRSACKKVRCGNTGVSQSDLPGMWKSKKICKYIVHAEQRIAYAGDVCGNTCVRAAAAPKGLAHMADTGKADGRMREAMAQAKTPRLAALPASRMD